LTFQEPASIAGSEFRGR